MVDSCLLIESFEVGEDIACLVACDDTGICDTTIVYVTIVAPDTTKPPVAEDNDTITVVNLPVLNYDILDNDTFDGETIRIKLLSDPLYGRVELNADTMVDFYPDPDFCGELDSFNYEIITPSGTSQATIYVEILCEDLTVFNGFSPNGDDVNDYFKILGIDRYPNNKLNIFNRWGNQVYFKQGYSNRDAWYGTWEGNPLPDGTYFYILDNGACVRTQILLPLKRYNMKRL